MKPRTIILAVFIILFFSSPNVFADRTSPLIIDHAATDVSQIPENWIEQAKSQMKWHYAHTSHGGQLTTGLDRIENQNSTLSYSRSTSDLPTTAGALCILDGMSPIGDAYITPNEYFSDNWDAPYHANTLLNRSEYAGRINVSAFSWCTQMNYSGYDTLVDDYLQAMTNLEQANPGVTFIYLTGNAQCGPDNHYCSDLDGGYRRYVRNEQIRAYCRNNNKVLFDFADIDSWWLNTETSQWEQATYEYQVGDQTINVPYEHPHYNLNQAAHTSFENCENKGKAVWHLMARLAGWGDCTSSPTGLIAQPDSEDQQIILSWTHNAPGSQPDRFIVQRRINEGPWVNDYGRVGGDTTTFTDSSLGTGHHQYRVVAQLDDGGEGNPCDSAASNVVSVQIGDANIPDAPSGLTVQ